MLADERARIRAATHVVIGFPWDAKPAAERLRQNGITAAAVWNERELRNATDDIDDIVIHTTRGYGKAATNGYEVRLVDEGRARYAKRIDVRFI